MSLKSLPPMPPSALGTALEEAHASAGSAITLASGIRESVLELETLDSTQARQLAENYLSLRKWLLRLRTASQDIDFAAGRMGYSVTALPAAFRNVFTIASKVQRAVALGMGLTDSLHSHFQSPSTFPRVLVLDEYGKAQTLDGKVQWREKNETEKATQQKEMEQWIANEDEANTLEWQAKRLHDCYATVRERIRSTQEIDTREFQEELYIAKREATEGQAEKDRFRRVAEMLVAPSSNTLKDSTTPPPGEPKKVKGRGINERMLAMIQSDPQSLYWSARKWAEALDCSESTIAGTPTWKKTCKAAKERQRIEREQMQEDKANGKLPTKRSR